MNQTIDFYYVCLVWVNFKELDFPLYMLPGVLILECLKTYDLDMCYQPILANPE